MGTGKSGPSSAGEWNSIRTRIVPVPGAHPQFVCLKIQNRYIAQIKYKYDTERLRMPYNHMFRF